MATSSFKSTTNDESSSASSASSSSTGTTFNAQGTTNNIAQSKARTYTSTNNNAQGTNNIAESRTSTSTSTTNDAQRRGRTSTSTTNNAQGTNNIAQRRARSLSRFSPRVLGPQGYSTPKGKFVNTKRGSEFVDVSLDDLALEFFGSSSLEKSGEDDEVGGRRSREVGRFARDTVSSKRRGRSVSRQRDGGSFGGSDVKSSISNGSREANSRRGRSISRQRGVGEVFRGTDDGNGLVSDGSRRSLAEVNSRRGRSVSRQGDFGEVFRGSDGKGLVLNDSRGKVNEADSRIRNRRRSLSVVRYQVSDSESDDLSQRSRHQATLRNLNNKSQIATSVTQAALNGRQLRRSLSQKDLSLYDYGYSRHSSALTDDDTRGSHMSKFGTEKTIREVYPQKKIEHPTEDDSTGLYEAVRRELRHAVEEIRIEHQQAMGREKANLQLDKADLDQVLSLIKQKCATMFKQSEKSNQDLPAKIKLEEQQARDLSRIIKEMVANFKRSAASQKPGWTKKRSNDRNKLSKQLGEEAEKYFEDFASNVEDTDISSFDGERSDASSSIGGTINEIDGTMRVEAQNYQSPAKSISHPTGTDGVILPWLQWETSNDSSLSGKTIRQPLRNSKALEWNVEPGMVTLFQDPNSNIKSSTGSSSPGLFDSKSNFQESGGCKRSQFDMEEYRHIKMKDELLFERYKERQRIDFGGLLLCAGSL